MKIIYFGTPELATTPLEALSKDKNIEILAVVTQQDKPQGRKQILTAPAVKNMALKLGLKVIQPKGKKSLLEELENLEKPDFFVVIAFGMILTEKILKIPKFGAINVHVSLLPKYRGASPIQESLLHGDKETGITIMKMDPELDHGGIFLVKRVPIIETDDLETLSKKVAETAALILPHALSDIKEGNLTPLPQNHEKATYCHKISKNDGKIDFNKSATEICNMIKAFTPWPGVYTEFDGKKLKIISTEKSDEQNEPGKFKIENKTLKIGTKNGSLIPTKLQIEGKNIMDVKSFINGYQSTINK